MVPCRTELEDAIQNKHGLGISVVVLVVGGDLRILNRCVKALERNIPIVVMKGTGMAADLVADVIDLPPETEVPKLVERINQHFEEIDEQTLKVSIIGRLGWHPRVICNCIMTSVTTMMISLNEMSKWKVSPSVFIDFSTNINTCMNFTENFGLADLVQDTCQSYYCL